MIISVAWLLSFAIDAILVASMFERRTVLSSIAPSVMLVLAFDCALYGLASILGLRMHLGVIAVAQILLCILMSLRCGRDYRNDARRMFDRADVIAWIVLGIVVFLLAYRQFGPDMQIRYTATDPSRHVFEIGKIVDSGLVSGQFAWWSFSAMLCEALNGLSIAMPTYKVFIVTDVISLLFSGLILYSIVKATDSFLAIALSVLMPVLYLIGYPLNVMVYGFCYLGAGVNYIALILFAVIATDVRLTKYAAVSLGALGLVTSYSLFAPPVFFALFLYIAHSERVRLASFGRLAIVEISVFAIPVVIGFLVVFLGIFSNLSVADALATEGGIYKSLFIDFMACTPFALIGFADDISSRHRSFRLIQAVILLIYAIVALIFGLKGYISSYYFYKMHFALWLVFFVFASDGLQRIAKMDANAAVCLVAPWAFVAIICLSGFDLAVSRAIPVFNPSPGSDALMPIVRFNRDSVDNKLPYPVEKIDLYERFDSMLKDSNAGSFAVLGTYVDIYWFEAIAGDSAAQSYYWNFDDRDLSEFYGASDYVLMMNRPDPAEDGGSFTTLSESNPYDLFDEYSSDYQIVYENAEGSILKK